MRSHGRALVAMLAMFAVMVAAGVTLRAQAPAQGGATTPPAAAPKGAAPAPGSAPGTQAAPAPAPQGFTYAPEGRRDPFVSLIGRASNQRPNTGTRLAGLPGLTVDEITLKGTLQSRGSYVAIVQGIDNKTYIVRAGDRLLDGTVRTITQDTMVIMQQVNDPLSQAKQREVRKTIRQIEEAK